MDNDTLAAMSNCPKDSSNYNYFSSFIPLAYGIPTIALNLVFTVLILRKKALSSVFFYQYIVFGTGNSLYWITSFIIDKVFTLPVDYIPSTSQICSGTVFSLRRTLHPPHANSQNTVSGLLLQYRVLLLLFFHYFCLAFCYSIPNEKSQGKMDFSSVQLTFSSVWNVFEWWFLCCS